MAAHGFGVREGGRVEANVVRSRRGLRLLVSCTGTFGEAFIIFRVLCGES